MSCLSLPVINPRCGGCKRSAAAPAGFRRNLGSLLDGIGDVEQLVKPLTSRQSAQRREAAEHDAAPSSSARCRARANTRTPAALM
jgi:hypothetical protein